MRPFLRPGLRRTRGPDGEVVVGPTGLRPLEPTEARLLAAADGVRDAADVLAQVPDSDAPAALARLLRQRILADIDLVLALLATLPVDVRQVAPPEVAGMLATDFADGLAVHERLQRRRLARVRVAGGEPLIGRLASALTASLLGNVICASDARRFSGDCTNDSLVVLAGDAEPPLQVIEHLNRNDCAHLVAVLHGATGVVGPLVVPGRTSCLRCLDLTRRDLDPHWAAHRLSLDRAAMSPSPSGVLPAPAPAVVVDLMISLAAADVVAWVDGRTPSTLGATVDVLPLTDSSNPTGLPWRRRTWPRHPECGCGWQLSATMEP